MIKKRRRKNLLSRQLSMCFKYGQHAKNNAVIISTQASTCTMYMSISVNGKKKKRKFQTSRSKAPPYFVYNSASLWFTCCFHFTFSSCSRDASAVNGKQGTKLKQQTKLMNIKELQISWDVTQLSNQPRPQGLLAFQYGGSRREDPGTQQKSRD